MTRLRTSKLQINQKSFFVHKLKIIHPQMMALLLFPGTYPKKQTYRLQRALILIIWLLCVDYSKAFIDTDGVCNVFVFAPFTTNFGYTEAIGLVDNSTNDGEAPIFGFHHMAAALFAAKEFNNRNVNSTAVSDGCNITLNISAVFDTGSLTQLASKRLAASNQVPCAIAGPFHSHPAIELSVMAQAFEYPIVVHRSFNPRTTSDFFSNYTTQVYPALQSSAKTLVSFLLEKQRTNYIALLYSGTFENFARRESLIFELDEVKVSWTTSSYTSPFSDNGVFANDEIRSPFAALKQIKQSGYRTIVVAMDSTGVLPIRFPGGELLGELQTIADAAEALQMNQGDYFWIWYDVFEPSIYDINENVSKIVGGSAWILPADRVVDSDFGWSSNGKEDVDQLNSLNPIPKREKGYRVARDDFFQHTPEPSYGSGFMYDAVISIGIGACVAKRKQDGTITGKEHVHGIRRASFGGKTGKVQFGSNTGDLDSAGARLPSTVSWVALNFLPPGMEESLNSSDLLLASNPKEWFSVAPFYYRDGRTVPPDLLRDQPDQNYLSNGLRIFGLVLMSLVILLAILSAIWVFACRKHRVLKASQPYFLYPICFGCVAQASAVLTISFDESHGKNVDQLSKACMALPWLLTMGHTVIYTSLFTKMWRVHKVLQFRRQRTPVYRLLWPMAIILSLDVVVLTLWTVLDPLKYERVEINPVTGESIGECVSGNTLAVWTVLVALLLIPMGMTEYFAWKTKDVDEAFTESKWVFFMTLWQIEVLCIGVPILVLLQDVSTDGRYLGYLFILLSFPASTLGFIFIPKIITYARDVRGIKDRPKRGERAHARVTGLSGHVPTTNNDGTPSPQEIVGISDNKPSDFVASNYENETPTQQSVEKTVKENGEQDGEQAEQ